MAVCSFGSVCISNEKGSSKMICVCQELFVLNKKRIYCGTSSLYLVLAEIAAACWFSLEFALVSGISPLYLRPAEKLRIKMESNANEPSRRS